MVTDAVAFRPSWPPAKYLPMMAGTKATGTEAWGILGPPAADSYNLSEFDRLQAWGHIHSYPLIHSRVFDSNWFKYWIYNPHPETPWNTNFPPELLFQPSCCHAVPPFFHQRLGITGHSTCWFEMIRVEEGSRTHFLKKPWSQRLHQLIYWCPHLPYVTLCSVVFSKRTLWVCFHCNCLGLVFASAERCFETLTKTPAARGPFCGSPKMMLLPSIHQGMNDVDLWLRYMICNYMIQWIQIYYMIWWIDDEWW